MDLVSVIIPYYKKKSSILYSVNSVLNQTYTNFEIIIIYDDEDKSDLDYICELKKKDNRISIIQNNGGPCWLRSNYPCNVNAVLYY